MSVFILWDLFLHSIGELDVSRNVASDCAQCYVAKSEDTVRDIHALQKHDTSSGVRCAGPNHKQISSSTNILFLWLFNQSLSVVKTFFFLLTVCNCPIEWHISLFLWVHAQDRFQNALCPFISYTQKHEKIRSRLKNSEVTLEVSIQRETLFVMPLHWGSLGFTWMWMEK